MSSYLLGDQFLQFALNAVISFFLFSLLTETILRLFRIRSFRLRACFRLLPPLRLALEPLFWLLPVSTILVNASLFSCSHPVQRFLLGRLPEAAQQELNLHGIKTILGKLLLAIPESLLFAALGSIAVIALHRLTSLIAQCMTSITQIKEIRHGATTSKLPITNAPLLKRLQHQRAKILISSEVDVPLAGWSNCIIIPEQLANELSQKEYEAVLSHELEHHRWHDTLLRVLCHAVAALYWWVPMGHWLHKVEQEQELACDAAAHKGEDLATALQKTIKTQQQEHTPCAAFANKVTRTAGQDLLERLETVLDPYGIRKQNPASAIAGAVVMLGFVLVLGFIIC